MLASETSDDDDGYPWLSWALTGVLALAGVLVVGLVISVWKPRVPTVAAGSGTGDGSKAQIQPLAPTESPPANPVPAVGAPPLGADGASGCCRGAGARTPAERPAAPEFRRPCHHPKPAGTGPGTRSGTRYPSSA